MTADERSETVLDALRFASIAEALHTAPTPTRTAEGVISYARAQLDATYGSITLIRRGGQLETVAPTDPLTVEIDRLQYELNEGICRDATWDGSTLQSRDIAADPRWPRWGPKAAALGVASMMAAELTGARGRRIGSVNLYWKDPHEFTREDRAVAELLARHAAIALTTSMTEQNLNTALDTRKRIGQAQGILMERHDLDEEGAFELLRRFSQDNNIKLREVAERVVATRSMR